MVQRVVVFDKGFVDRAVRIGQSLERAQVVGETTRRRDPLACQSNRGRRDPALLLFQKTSTEKEAVKIGITVLGAIVSTTRHVCLERFHVFVQISRGVGVGKVLSPDGQGGESKEAEQ